MGILYDLEKIKTADFTNPNKIKENILHSIQTSEPLEFIHIKCLRFSYPGGNSLRLLDIPSAIIILTIFLVDLRMKHPYSRI